MATRPVTDPPVPRLPPPGDGSAGVRLPGALAALLSSSMLRYVVRRVLWGAFMLLVVTALTFLIFFAFPSADPAALRAGRQATPELIAQIRHSLGLDRPLYVQYGRFLKGLVLHFDLGYSYQNEASVRSELFARLPATISLTLGAFVVWMLAAIPVGVVSALRRRSHPRPGAHERRARSRSRRPSTGSASSPCSRSPRGIGLLPFLPGAGSYTPLTVDAWRWFTSLLLPWIVLAAAFAAFYARMVRGNLIDVLGEDYIRTARAKGLRERDVVYKHALRSALTPLVTMAGLDLGILLGGAILTETVFNIPGVGRYAYDAIVNADLPAIQGTVLLGAVFIITANIVVDILYAFLDPRVRY